MMRVILAIVAFVAGLFRKAQTAAPTLELPAPVDEPETSSSSASFETAVEFDTNGPSLEEHPAITVGELVGAGTRLERGQFVGGWWTQARQFPIHKGRQGGNIVGKCTVVHTTDMAPGTMAPLLKRWRDLAGEGAGAHFLIGKQAAGVGDPIPSGGIVQMLPITRNGNHAGGSKLVAGKRVASHGWFKSGTKLIHPNLVAIGIEVDNAGRLVQQGGNWIHKDTGKIIPKDRVYVDSRGRGWEKITDYQWLALEALLDALDGVLDHFELGVVVVSNGTYQLNNVPYAAINTTREVGHCTLDPNRKTDPGPEIMAWLNARSRRS